MNTAVYIVLKPAPFDHAEFVAVFDSWEGANRYIELRPGKLLYVRKTEVSK